MFSRLPLPDVTIADFIAAGDQCGCNPLSSATTPDTCGAAIDVPDMKTYESSFAAKILAPGAAMSGCFCKEAGRSQGEIRWVGIHDGLDHGFLVLP